MGFRVEGLGFRVEGLEFRSLGCGVWLLEGSMVGRCTVEILTCAYRRFYHAGSLPRAGIVVPHFHELCPFP